MSPLRALIEEMSAALRKTVPHGMSYSKYDHRNTAYHMKSGKFDPQSRDADTHVASKRSAVSDLKAKLRERRAKMKKRGV